MVCDVSIKVESEEQVSNKPRCQKKADIASQPGLYKQLLVPRIQQWQHVSMRRFLRKLVRERLARTKAHDTRLPRHQEWDTGRARTRRQHEELSPANNFDMLPCCRFRNVAPRASRRCAEPPRVWYTEGHNDKTAHNAVTSRQVQLDRSTHARKRAGGSLWHCTPHSRQLLQSVLIRFYPWKCSRDFAISLGSFLTWCDLGDFDSPAISVALSKALSRLAETQGN